MEKVNVLFVCLGNICRSPTAHGVFQKMVDDEGLSDPIYVDSAGTSGWHINESPDKRTTQVAMTKGVDLTRLRGRQVNTSDFDKFDYVLAMDKSNLADLKQIAPKEIKCHLGLFLDFSHNYRDKDVPDPYYGGAAGFEKVFSMVEEASSGLLDQIKIDLAS